MFIIVGLGNPGTEYQNTPHNIGFLALDFFQKENNFPDFRLSAKNKALISENSLGGQKIILAKPQTFMNVSGQTVKKLAKPKSVIIVLHDDLAFPLGTIKINENRGANHHKGVESIIKELGHQKFIRIRLGTKLTEPLKKADLTKLVLKPFPATEQANLNQAISQAALALKTVIESGLEKAMTQFNQKPTPPKP